MRTIICVWCLGLLVMASTVLGTPSGLIIFGDSLSDVGNITSGPPYWNGRFSNGPVWVEDLATMMGLGAPSFNPGPQPNFIDYSVVLPDNGGRDYAIAGATAQIYLVNGTNYGKNLLGEVTRFLQNVNNVAPSNALYVVLAGGNDLRKPSPDATAAAAAVVAQIDLLASKGATEFLVGNYWVTATADQTSRDLTTSFNAALHAQVLAVEAARGCSIHEVDLYSFYNTVAANPAAYGLTNVVDPLQNAPNGTDPSTYFFYDSMHPSAAGHQLIAQAAYAAVPEPGSLLLVGAFAGLMAIRRR